MFCDLISLFLLEIINTFQHKDFLPFDRFFIRRGWMPSLKQKQGFDQPFFIGWKSFGKCWTWEEGGLIRSIFKLCLVYSFLVIAWVFSLCYELIIVCDDRFSFGTWKLLIVLLLQKHIHFSLQMFGLDQVQLYLQHLPLIDL